VRKEVVKTVASGE